MCCLNYEYDDFSSLCMSDKYFKFRFRALKMIKESDHKVSMIVYCNVLCKICFLKIILKPSNSLAFDVYNVLKNKKHKNIEEVYDIIKTDKFVYIITEFIDGKNLLSIQSPSKRIINLINDQICDGLEFLHNNCIVHGDIKLENVILTQDDVIKIVDFDLSRICQDYITLKTAIGSDNYMAPECFDLSIYSKKSDIWSFGILMYKLLVGKFPYILKPNKLCHLYSHNNFKNLDFDELDKLKDIHGDVVIKFVKNMLEFVDDKRNLVRIFVK